MADEKLAEVNFDVVVVLNHIYVSTTSDRDDPLIPH